MTRLDSSVGGAEIEGNWVSPYSVMSVRTAALGARLLCSKYLKKTKRRNSFIDTNLIHNFFYINYIKLSSSTCFERHPFIFRRSMMLIVHVCSLWYSHFVKVNYSLLQNENTRDCIHVQLTSLTS